MSPNRNDAKLMFLNHFVYCLSASTWTFVVGVLVVMYFKVFGKFQNNIQHLLKESPIHPGLVKSSMILEYSNGLFVKLHIILEPHVSQKPWVDYHFSRC